MRMFSPNTSFLDETTGRFYQEYIEPLVSHLRFPLAQCLDDNENSEALAGLLVT
jgi:hypothetical protein